MRTTPSTLWQRRHLLRVLTASNLKRQGKNTTLGYLWWLLDPMLMTAVYFLLVAVVFKHGKENQPFVLFVLCGLLAWKAFADSVSQSVRSIVGQAGIVRSISFPKGILPLSFVFSNAIFFAVALLIAVGLGLLYGPTYGTWPNIYYLFLPVVICLQVLFTVGVAVIMAAMGVLFKDTGNIVGHLLRVWYFMSPGLYSPAHVPKEYLSLFEMNPFCGLMTAYRDILMHGRMPNLGDLTYVLVAGLISCSIGLLLFNRLETRLVQNL